jgi:hypothetical protein
VKPRTPPPRDWTPQKFDSIARTATTSVISIGLVTAVIVEAINSRGAAQLTGLDAALIGWAGTVVGFYLGGHVAQNTAGLEEARLKSTAAESAASAVRSQLSAVASQVSADQSAGEQPKP